jgi:hypothetical protein
VFLFTSLAQSPACLSALLLIPHLILSQRVAALSERQISKERFNPTQNKATDKEMSILLRDAGMWSWCCGANNAVRAIVIASTLTLLGVLYVKAKFYTVP